MHAPDTHTHTHIYIYIQTIDEATFNKQKSIYSHKPQTFKDIDQTSTFISFWNHKLGSRVTGSSDELLAAKPGRVQAETPLRVVFEASRQFPSWFSWALGGSSQDLEDHLRAHV